MKQSTYAQKLNEAIDDRRKLMDAADVLAGDTLLTFEAKHVRRELDAAIDKLNATIERYRKFLAIEAKQDGAQ